VQARTSGFALNLRGEDVDLRKAMSGIGRVHPDSDAIQSDILDLVAIGVALGAFVLEASEPWAVQRNGAQGAARRLG
jgi:hypothetical protein